MRALGPGLVVLICAGCSRTSTSVVGRWQAFLGSGTAAKLYYGKPAPTEFDFRSDGTYSVRMMWGARSLAETGGTYEVTGDMIRLTPAEELDRDVWPGREVLRLSPDGRSFVLPMPKSMRVPEARFIRLRFP